MNKIVFFTLICKTSKQLIHKSVICVNFQRNFQSFPTLLQHKWGSKKKNRQIKLNFIPDTMTDPKTEEILAPLRAQVKEQVCKIILFKKH